MNYEFPIIKHINDVLPAIKDSPEFIVAEKDGYVVINYVVSTEDTFPPVTDTHSAIRRECRGLVFSPDGQLIARRYHKFFNVNEREETQIRNIDLTEPHVVYDKLDGSMITPIKIGDSFRWGTKMGVTDVALPVEEFVAENPNYNVFAHACFDRELTPIFEWVSRKQKIVLDYEEDALILTAIRDNTYGFYYTQTAMEIVAGKYNIPTVNVFQHRVDDLSPFIAKLSKEENIEGVVVRFENGHMVKIKTEWYVMIHKAKDKILREHDVCLGILENTLDDVKPFLPASDLEKVVRYEKDLMEKIYEYCNYIFSALSDLSDREVSRKDYALAITNNSFEKPIIFKCWDDRSFQKVEMVVLGIIKKNCAKAKHFEDMKSQILKGLKYA